MSVDISSAAGSLGSLHCRPRPSPWYSLSPEKKTAEFSFGVLPKKYASLLPHPNSRSRQVP